jgi:hypothetical protein
LRNRKNAVQAALLACTGVLGIATTFLVGTR